MHRINEEFLDPDDIQKVLKTASILRPGKSKFFGLLGKKSRISDKDLEKQWIKDGRPADSRKLAQFLAKLGYQETDIKRVFQSVFNTDGGSSGETRTSPVIVKIAEYIKANGYEDEIIGYIENNFNIDLKENVVTIGQIKTIFERIMHEERTELPRLQREFEQQSLGRYRK